MKTVEIGSISIGANHPLVLIAGPCVIESEKLVLSVAEKIQKIVQKLHIPFIFKSSYLKDNRSSAASFQGPGIDKGLRILEKVKNEFGIPVLSDVHNQHDADKAAEILDIIQIPAYLSMQTSLTLAIGKTGKVVNVKKGQFLDPKDVKNIIGKLESVGNHNILLTERGSCFGYHNLIVDFRSIEIMKTLGYPVVFDPTHAIRIYGIPSSDMKGGAPQFVPALSKAAIAVGIQALFIETHPDCEQALCDAASMWPLQQLESLLIQLKSIDDLIHRLDPIALKGS
jgi:2-dehydro-3-deoxyphosphooctonate aldolase (KDO 8-P synthase)